MQENVNVRPNSPNSAVLDLIRLLEADRPSWSANTMQEDLWSEALSRYAPSVLMEAGRRFLTEEAGAPNLARIKRFCDMVVKEQADSVRWRPSQVTYSEKRIDPDLLLWMRFWPAAVPPGELRERHEKAWRSIGREPYYPPLDAQIKAQEEGRWGL